MDQQTNENQNLEGLLWRHVSASGEFLEQFHILLDNQVIDSQAGYFVYTPFRFANSDKYVLVNQGWLLANPDRTILPKLNPGKGIVTIKGVIKEAPKTGLLLKKLPPEKVNQISYRVQRIDVEELKALTRLNLAPYIIRLEPDSDHGYTRKWRLPGSGESMHNGYAFQWFSFATVLLIIYLLLNVKKIEE